MTATVAAVGAFALGACSSSPPAEFSAEGERGRALTEEVGCAGCHGGFGESAEVGPSWVGSWGDDVELDDGTALRFDADYVITAVREPDVHRRPGDWVRMPAYGLDQLTDEELDAIVAYIEELG